MSFFRQIFWDCQPDWAKLLFFLVGIPTFFGLRAFDPFDYPSLNLGLLFIFGAAVLVQLFFIARAFYRSDV